MVVHPLLIVVHPSSQASYADVRWVATSLPDASYASKRLTKFALNKEKVGGAPLLSHACLARHA